MNKKSLITHMTNLYYSLVPLIFYILSRSVVFSLGNFFHWNAQISNLIGGVINFIGLYVIFYRNLHKKRMELFNAPNLENQHYSAYLWVMLAGVCACLFLNNLVLLLGLRQQIVSYERVSQAIYSGNYALMAIQVIVVAPLTEELLFRGLIYQSASLSIGIAPAAFLSSLLFAIMHGNLLQGVYAFVFGFVLIFAMEQLHTMKANVVCHIAANLISVIGTTTICLQFMYQSAAVMLGFTVIVGLLFLFCLIKLKLISIQQKYENIRKTEITIEKQSM